MENNVKAVLVGVLTGVFAALLMWLGMRLFGLPNESGGFAALYFHVKTFPLVVGAAFGLYACRATLGLLGKLTQAEEQEARLGGKRNEQP